MTYTWKNPKPHTEHYTFAQAHGVQPKHIGVELAPGVMAHVDPNASPETIAALQRLAELAIQAIEEGRL